MTHSPRDRTAGSVRFAPYFKVQLWEERSLAWYDVQQGFPSLEAAAFAARDGLGASRWRIMEVSMEGRKPVLEARSAEQVAADPQPGDIYYTSWGYDQTNVEFFQVVRRTPGTVTLRSIAARVQNGRLYPCPGEWARDGLLDGNPGSPACLRAEEQGYTEKVCRLQLKARKRQTSEVQPGLSLTIDEVRSAWPYDFQKGEGKYDTNAAGGAGH